MRETRWNTLEYSPPYLSADSRNVPTDKNVSLNGQSSFDWYCTPSKTLRKRPGSVQSTNILSGKMIKKIWLYETLPVAGGLPYAFLIFSVLDNSTLRYSLYSHRYDAGAIAPTAITGLRESNESEKVHQIAFSKGLAYVKGFPRAASGEKYGTIILDGITGSIAVRPWGMVPPTTPARLTGATTRLTASVTATDTTFNIVSDAAFPATPFDFWIGYEKCTATAKGGTNFTVTRAVGGTEAQAHDDDTVILYHDWTASDHKIDVNLGWKYTYAYVSITGQVSNRADIEYNPDLLPSNTGPFFDLIPKIQLPGNSDTTNIPYINIYRTTDGGGTFYFLKRITNTGAGTITFEDKYFQTGALSTTEADPIPDDKLDVAQYAPSLTSNSPPPGVVPPLINGTDTPSQSCYSICTFSSRIWYGVDHYLFFSSREETRAGVGEECFPSGNLGNFFIFDSAVVGVASTTDSLYVFTTKDVYRLTGSSLDTFSFTKIVADVGCFVGNNSVESFRNSVAFFTSDRQVAIITGDQIRVISQPLGWFPFAFYTNGQANLDITYYRDNDNEWLIAGVCNKDTGVPDSVGRMWVYDLQKSDEQGKPFWNPTWIVPASAMGAFRSSRYQLSRFFWATGDSVIGTSFVQEFVMNPSHASFYTHSQYISNPSTGVPLAESYQATLVFSAIACPSGFNLNQVNSPRRDTRFYSMQVSYANVGVGSIAPTPSLLQDQYDTLLTPVVADPPRIQIAAAGTGLYLTYEYHFDREVNVIYPVISTGANTSEVEIYQLLFTFDAKANP